MLDEMKFETSEEYDANEISGHYLKVFNEDRKDQTLTLLVREDRWGQVRGQDYLTYQSSAVAISREDALALAEWINERFK